MAISFMDREEKLSRAIPLQLREESSFLVQVSDENFKSVKWRG